VSNRVAAIALAAAPQIDLESKERAALLWWFFLALFECFNNELNEVCEYVH
jgi:hypothetical protein